MDYDDYFELNTISQINMLEKNDILDYLEYTYKDNFSASKFNLTQFPRIAIISGYYAMHDISKLYLAIKYNIKFTKPSVHDAVIKALKKLVKKQEILDLIDSANQEFVKIQRLDYFLSKGKAYREKTQYYTGSSYSKEEIINIATNFLNNIVSHYIEIVETLIKEEVEKKDDN